jgi:hypothetical protein
MQMRLVAQLPERGSALAGNRNSLTAPVPIVAAAAAEQ